MLLMKKKKKKKNRHCLNGWNCGVPVVCFGFVTWFWYLASYIIGALPPWSLLVVTRIHRVIGVCYDFGDGFVISFCRQLQSVGVGS
ncbi:hypothetical protein RchiOBHm_Chr7g0196971 [Rosa chinensis]|uniref:Transmembrane protein n=1 Tax=Rosa chinensis TaxID=74649 RepID=A0A2P6P6R6_ROSCH|nr:hypothetical protein RchiOBHm_Chr7g0196971 [Rosa chinensis]